MWRICFRRLIVSLAPVIQGKKYNMKNATNSIVVFVEVFPIFIYNYDSVVALYGVCSFFVLMEGINPFISLIFTETDSYTND